jgi:hypothetical protein
MPVAQNHSPFGLQMLSPGRAGQRGMGGLRAPDDAP